MERQTHSLHHSLWKLFLSQTFGITSAPEIFQREMSSGEIKKAVYTDDVLIDSDSEEVHDVRLHTGEVGLKLNHDQRLLRQRRLKFLVHCTDEHGMRRPQPDH